MSFSKGDRVIIVQKIHDRNRWPVWVPSMNYTIGKKGTIKTARPWGSNTPQVFHVILDDKDLNGSFGGWWYLEEALQHADQDLTE